MSRPSGPKVIVVGGGVIGVSCAYALVRAGVEVVLFERSEIGSGASSGNAGTVAAGHGPLHKPGRVAQGVRQMLDPTSPLYIRPRWDPRLWGWLAKFARLCTHEHVAHCMRVMGPLGLESLSLFDQIVRDERIECDYQSNGYMAVCSTEEALASVREEADLMRSHGYSPALLNPDDVLAREPTLNPDLIGGVHYPEARTMNPSLFLRRLSDTVVRRGARIVEGRTVTGVRSASGAVEGVTWTAASETGSDYEPADAVVIATGPFGLSLLDRQVGRLPVQPGKGYHRDVEIGPNGAPALRSAVVLSESSVFCTPMDTFVRFAGTMEFSGLNSRLERARLSQLTTSARTAFPSMGIARPRSEWSGLRPMSVDGLPIVGEVPGASGLYVATGHGMLGLTLAPITGQLICDAVLDRADVSVPELSPRRFVKRI